MFRLLGFITGTALAVGVIVMVMGMPAWRDLAPATSETPPPAEPLPDTAPPREGTPAGKPGSAIAGAPAGTASPLDTGPDSETAFADQAADFIAPPAATEGPETTAATPAETGPAPTDLPDSGETGTRSAEPQWHSFWNPFRSEIAANGFAARLTAVTGLDYRVLRLEPGVYQVAFAYADDGERAASIAQIESATGLDLPEASP